MGDFEQMLNDLCKMSKAQLVQMVRNTDEKEKMEAITELAAIKNRKKVRCDDTGEIYSSIRAASVATGISRANISNCAHGQYKQACGQHWSFV